MAFFADTVMLHTEVTWTDILGTILVLFFTVISTLQKAGLLCCFSNQETDEGKQDKIKKQSTDAEDIGNKSDQFLRQ